MVWDNVLQKFIWKIKSEKLWEESTMSEDIAVVADNQLQEWGRRPELDSEWQLHQKHQKVLK